MPLLLALSEKKFPVEAVASIGRLKDISTFQGLLATNPEHRNVALHTTHDDGSETDNAWFC